MFDDLVAIVVPVALFLSLAFTVAGVTKVVTDSRVRRKLVEAGASPELTAAVLAPLKADPELYSSLKGGLVIAAVGLALIVVQFLPFRLDEPIVLGLVLLFGGGGLLAYYASARRLASRRVAQ